MKPVTIITWKWKDENWMSQYSADHVNILADAITRNTKVPHRIFCITDDADGIDKSIGIIKMWDDFKELGHCYRRLKAFSDEMESMVGDRFFSIDLDTVITGDITEILTSRHDFVIAKDTQRGTPYNGSFWGMNTGARKQVYEEFKNNPEGCIEAARAMGYSACDQAVMALIMGEKEITLSQNDGLYSFKNDLAGLSGDPKPLPENAKMVFFHGHPKPWDEAPLKLSWVKKNTPKSKKSLLILGGAGCVWKDLETFDRTGFDVMAINDMGWAFDDRIDFWVTLHPEKMEDWMAKRKGNKDFQTWSHADIPAARIDKILSEYWKSDDGISGSSGLFAVQVGLKLGYDEIVLAGVPMDGTNNQTGPKECWNENVALNFRKAWVLQADFLRGRVKSLSGWTKTLLGQGE